MEDFIIHPRLKDDCFILGKLELSLLLLMNNSLVPWFILVPRTSAKEFSELNNEELVTLFTEIKSLSKYVKGNFNVSKLNVAAIGNVVSQFHVHIVGRNPSDYCWPGVVWGTEEKEKYTAARVLEIRASISACFGDELTKV